MADHYHAPFLGGQFYHIYNRGNNGDNLFHTAANYAYFLKKYNEILGQWLDVYAFCLLPNHFHLLVRVKEQPTQEDLDKQITNQFRRFFIGYTQAIQKQEGRTGSLFQKNFKRIMLEDNDYFTRLIYYIHANPYKHGVDAAWRTYPWSSYARMLASKPTKLCKEAVLSWFGGADAYVDFHTGMLAETSEGELYEED